MNQPCGNGWRASSIFSPIFPDMFTFLPLNYTKCANDLTTPKTVFYTPLNRCPSSFLHDSIIHFYTLWSGTVSDRAGVTVFITPHSERTICYLILILIVKIFTLIYILLIYTFYLTHIQEASYVMSCLPSTFPPRQH